jgi:hypothetical protein
MKLKILREEMNFKLKDNDSYLNISLNKKDIFFSLTEDIQTAHKFTLGGNRGYDLFYENKCLNFDKKNQLLFRVINNVDKQNLYL